MPAAKKKTNVTITSVRLDKEVLKGASKKAAKLGISRSLYFQQLLRKDLGLEGIEIDPQPSVFG